MLRGSSLAQLGAYAAHHKVQQLQLARRPPRTRLFSASVTVEAASASKLGKLQQSLNVAGIALFLRLYAGKDRQLAIPHITVTDITCIDWAAMRAAGLVGVVFDKDNTLTAPYAPTVSPHLSASLASCVAAFDGKVVLLSNSAGLKQYDPDGTQADALEATLGVRVLRHGNKKPGGGCAELEKHFGCSAAQLVMVGDRYFTDIVYGNRHGMLTVRTAPFTKEGESVTVKASRRLEESAVRRWLAKGTVAPPHAAGGQLESMQRPPGVASS